MSYILLIADYAVFIEILVREVGIAELKLSFDNVELIGNTCFRNTQIMYAKTANEQTGTSSPLDFCILEPSSTLKPRSYLPFVSSAVFGDAVTTNEEKPRLIGIKCTLRVGRMAKCD